MDSDRRDFKAVMALNAKVHDWQVREINDYLANL